MIALPLDGLVKANVNGAVVGVAISHNTYVVVAIAIVAAKGKHIVLNGIVVSTKGNVCHITSIVVNVHVHVCVVLTAANALHAVYKLSVQLAPLVRHVGGKIVVV